MDPEIKQQTLILPLSRFINDYGQTVALDGSACPENVRKFAEYIKESPLEYDSCSGLGGPIFDKAAMTDIYKNSTTEGAPENKKNRWEVILGEDRYLKCRQDPSGDTDGDTKSVRVYKICTGDGCMPGSPSTVFDEIYIGRVEINGGNKDDHYILLVTIFLKNNE